MLFRALRISIVMLLVMTGITGVLYPFAITVIANTLFVHQSRGSVLTEGSHSIGSELIGQAFTDPAYFWSRPSATGPVPYNAAASSGSNLGPSNPALQTAIHERVQKLKDAGGSQTIRIPVDLVTASGSGLDPHISPAAADYQILRIAQKRGVSEADVKQLVTKYTEGRQLGLLGEPRVNVLRLNVALDHAFPLKKARATE
ncbi:MAG: potassium-transporting ATPase subunit [Planctomycetaceae bacterium]|nr:potassium-transporting ATPase subunit [Planctomycetaceae bacterium]